MIALTWLAALLAVAAAAGKEGDLQLCPEVKKADIMVVVDESGSVTATGWEDQVNFLSKVFTSLPIGPEQVQVGVIQFATKANKIFDLNKYQNKTELETALKELKYTQQSLTYTDKALALARENLLNGTGAREKTQKVVMVLTDGASNLPNKTIEEAEKLHDAKIKVFVVGVGNTKMEELKAMASEEKFVVHTKDTKSLLAKDFIQKNILEKFKCVTKCTKVQKADVVFLIDQSQSIGKEGFQKEKDFLSAMVNNLTVAQENVHVGIIAFAEEAKSVVKLSEFKTKPELLQSVKDLKWNWGRTQTHKGIAVAAKYFSKEGGMREGIPHVLVVLSDGKSTETKKTIQAVKDFKASAAKPLIVAIGVGDKTDADELATMASEKRYILKAETFKDLASFSFVSNEVLESVDCVVMTMSA